MGHHRVRKHVWQGGRLKIIDTWFESFEQAIEHSNTFDVSSVKIFDPNDELMFSKTPIIITNYASGDSYAGELYA